MTDDALLSRREVLGLIARHSSDGWKIWPPQLYNEIMALPTHPAGRVVEDLSHRLTIADGMDDEHPAGGTPEKPSVDLAPAHAYCECSFGFMPDDTGMKCRNCWKPSAPAREPSEKAVELLRSYELTHTRRIQPDGDCGCDICVQARALLAAVDFGGAPREGEAK